MKYGWKWSKFIRSAINWKYISLFQSIVFQQQATLLLLINTMVLVLYLRPEEMGSLYSRSNISLNFFATLLAALGPRCNRNWMLLWVLQWWHTSQGDTPLSVDLASIWFRTTDLSNYNEQWLCSQKENTVIIVLWCNVTVLVLFQAVEKITNITLWSKLSVYCTVCSISESVF